MTVARSTAATMASLVTLAREFGEDTSTQNPKWTDTQWLNGLRLAAIDAYVDARMLPGYVEMTYTADEVSVEVPADVGHAALYQLQDITSPEQPNTISPAPVNHVFQPNVRQSPANDGMAQLRRRWAVVAGTTPNFRPRILIHPTPTRDLSVRLFYFPSGLTASSSADNFFMNPANERYIALAAARDKRKLAGEWTRDMEELYLEAKQRYLENSAPYQGVKHLPKRSYRTTRG